ncbi:fimbrial protein [Morganella morganii]|uniref:fimbrial protein n=1 Tax=Morganella morganii TaxID=582 RepID=UPI0004682284|nr:fimbrial protein [Morganella morganii]
MKKTLLASLLTSVTFICSYANAADGQIKFSGSVIDNACDVTNNLANPLNVNMGKISKSVFNNATGVTASSSTFSLVLKNCPNTVSGAQIKFDGTSASGDNNVLSLTQETGVAKGIGIQLTDDTNTVIPLYSASKNYELKPNKENELNFIARYISISDDVEPGAANAVANFTINYN